MNPITTKELHRRISINPDGTITNLGGTDERATTEADGSTTYTKTDITITTIDGAVITQGMVAYHCGRCASGPYSNQAVQHCAACQRTICPTCTAISPAGVLCADCNHEHKRAALRAFFLSIE